jgi:hypothetical protein
MVQLSIEMMRSQQVVTTIFEDESSWIAQTLNMVAANSYETAVNYLPSNTKYCIVLYLFRPRNHYRMILDTSIE